MATIEQDINLYENQGALLTVGPGQVISFSNFQDPITGEVAVDDANNDIQWDFGETATFEGAPATLVATGTASIGVTIASIPNPVPFLPPLFPGITVTLSSPVRVAVVVVNGEQFVRFYNEDGTEADPAALLDGLASQLVTALGPLGDLVLGVIGDPLAYVENNALLTFNLSNTSPNGTALIPCFTAGTLIATGRGEVKVEDLVVGDLVLTVDRGLQAIRWVGSKILSPQDLALAPNLAPIQIEAGALGPDLPHVTLTVSPQHRCLVRSKIAERIAGEAEVLVAAKHLLGTPGVSVVPADQPVTYIHLLFDRHELVWSNGAVTESLYLGEQAMSSVDAEARDEILTLFPKLAELRPPAARPFLRGRLARKLVERSVSNRKVLVEVAGQRAKVLTNA